MDSFEYIIVGSGPAGVSAARRFDGASCCMLDSGTTPPGTFPHASLKNALATGDSQSLLGKQWEMLENISNPYKKHAKLRAADSKSIANGELFRVRGKNDDILLESHGSYGMGGMSETWGAQLFPYTDADLTAIGGWPVSAEKLAPYYMDLQEHIGIAGVQDDMDEFLGPTPLLLPPAPIVPASQYLLKKYELAKRKNKKLALTLGRSRLAVLTREYNGYAPHNFGETEFFTTSQQGLYTAKRTLEELMRRGRHTYFGGHRLIKWKETPDYVEVTAINENDGKERILRAKHLLLACGVIHTAKLLLLNRNEAERRLPFIDHPPTLVPLFIPALFGSALPNRSFPVQLVATRNQNQCDMISLYYPGGMLWSDFLADMPLPFPLSLRMLKTLLGGMLVAQIWEPSRPSPANFLTLDKNGDIEITYAERKPYSGLKEFLKTLRTLGAFSIPRLASSSPPGWGFHYAATLPMRLNPKEYETHIDGRLWDSQRVRVIDGSVLPSLPAKNHSLTIMANAARIAEEVKQCGY